MSNATTVQFGAVNSTGDRNALFLKVFGGEVLAAFEETNVTRDKHVVRSIPSGKSAAFPATWKVSASYHTPGNEILGQSSNANERVIVIDDLLVAPVFIAKIDEAKAHYDVRSIYSRECGAALARAWDRNVLQLGVKAARSSATVSGGNGGTVLENASFASDGAAIAAGLFAAGQAMDEKDVPEHDRYAYFKPAQYAILAQTTNVINRDWGGAGVYAEGSVLKVNGIHIVKTNNLPSTNVGSGPTAYQGDFTNTKGLVMQKFAVGTVKLLDLATEMGWDMRRQGTLIVAKYAIGSGILRPECAVELTTDDGE